MNAFCSFRRTGRIFYVKMKGYDVMNETTARSMELTDTAELMASSDYKDRFKAEYGQVAIRCEKLKAMLERWDKGGLNFTPTCPRSLYELQVRAMEDYIAVLQARAARRFGRRGRRNQDLTMLRKVV